LGRHCGDAPRFGFLRGQLDLAKRSLAENTAFSSGFYTKALIANSFSKVVAWDAFTGGRNISDFCLVKCLVNLNPKEWGGCHGEIWQGGKPVSEECDASREKRNLALRKRRQGRPRDEQKASHRHWAFRSTQERR
jgi:hypothetical protein